MQESITAGRSPSRSVGMRSIRAIALTMAAAILASLAVLAIGASSGAVSDPDTIAARVRAADAAGGFPWDSHRNQEPISPNAH